MACLLALLERPQAGVENAEVRRRLHKRDAAVVAVSRGDLAKSVDAAEGAALGPGVLVGLVTHRHPERHHEAGQQKLLLTQLDNRGMDPAVAQRSVMIDLDLRSIAQVGDSDRLTEQCQLVLVQLEVP